jgi:hypothetical protein
VTDRPRPPADHLGDDATGEAARRGRAVLARQVGTMLAYAAGASLLFLQPWTWSAGFWLGWACFALVLGALLWWQHGTDAGRRRQDEGLLAESAVLRYVNPGPGRHGRADDTARAFVGRRLSGWLVTLAFLALPLIGGRWDRPGWAVPGAVLLVLGGTVQLLALEREARAGRRWLADPPGPRRD